MKTPWLAAPILVLTIFVTPALKADVVYDNLQTQGPFGILITTFEYGNEVTLAGNKRIATQASLAVLVQKLNVDGPGNGEITLNLYANDGLGGAPGSLLWSGQQTLVTPQPPPFGANYLEQVDFDLPNIKLPNSFTWTTSMVDLDDREDEYGFYRYEPVAVGSFEAAWFRQADGSTAWTNPSATSSANNPMGFQLTAIPEPNSCLWIVLSWVGLATRRKTR